MGKRVISQEKKVFLQTIQDIRKLVGQHRGQYAKDTMGLNKKNTKVPFDHLQGRRQKLKERHQQEKSRAREESIQYDSSMKLLNSAVMEQRKEKDQFEKNKYKYQEGNAAKLGRQVGGFLHLNKKDVARIRGDNDEDKQRPKQPKGKKPFKGGNKQSKRKPVKKGKGKHKK